MIRRTKDESRCKNPRGDVVVEIALRTENHPKPVVLVPVGYPAKTPKAPDRLPMTDCVKVLP